MRIKERREFLGLSTRKLAEQIGISSATISRYENGLVNKIDNSILLKLCAVLECSPEYLLETDNVCEELPNGLITFNGNLIFENIKYTFILKDESMQPMIKKNSMLLISESESFLNGDIVCFMYDERVLIRIYRQSENNIWLTAVNNEYVPICVPSLGDLTVFGKCVKQVVSL